MIQYDVYVLTKHWKLGGAGGGDALEGRRGRKNMIKIYLHLKIVLKNWNYSKIIEYF